MVGLMSASESSKESWIPLVGTILGWACFVFVMLFVGLAGAFLFFGTLGGDKEEQSEAPAAAAVAEEQSIAE